MQIPPPLDPIPTLKEHFPEGVLFSKQFRGDTTIVVTAAALVSIMQYLRNTPGLIYNFLSDMSAVDYYPNDYGPAFDGRDQAVDPKDPNRDQKTGYVDFRPERFGVAYHLYSMLYNRRLRIKAFAPEEAPTLPTVTPVWPGANWLEREIADMMGVKFEGHPDQRRLLLPDDWDGHPHRRDYPMGKEMVQFSFNVEDILKHKPFARD